MIKLFNQKIRKKINICKVLRFKCRNKIHCWLFKAKKNCNPNYLI